MLPLAIVHTLGNLLTNVSLGQVAVSFTHTIKVGQGATSALYRLESVSQVLALLREFVNHHQPIKAAELP